MHRTRLEFGWSVAPALGALFLSACLFGGDQDLPPSAGPALSDSSPKPGWYKGDYGSLGTDFGIESELILAQDSVLGPTIEYIGIQGNIALFREKGGYSADSASLTVTNRAWGFADFDTLFDSHHSGIFNYWLGLSDSTYSIRVYEDGSFERYENALNYFDVDPDSVPAVVLKAPQMWVRYRPSAMAPIATGRYEYREDMPFGSGVLPGFYRDVDFRGCGLPRFTSRVYFLNDAAYFTANPPGSLGGWWGWELESTQWSRLGSFIVARNFRERLVNEADACPLNTLPGPCPWYAESGDYLLRVIRFDNTGLALWGSNPGFWAGLENDTASCPAPAPSPAVLSRASSGR